jgi:hypothetical protein
MALQQAVLAEFFFSFTSLIMLLLLCTPLLGHVSMKYVEGSDLAIRSANSATGDGRANVQNACGGNAAPGANGKGTIKDGDEVTLAINYAAGHQSAQNAFSMRFACGDGSAGSVEAASAKLTAAANNCKGTASGAAATYGANGIPAPKAIVPGGYTVTCTLPKQEVTAAKDCVISLADQRDWGGCVDVSVLPAAAALPPAPPPAPLVSNSGTYAFSEANKVDTSAATFTCCALSDGSLEVPSYSPLNAPSFTANFKKVKARGCRTSDLETAPTTASHTIDGPVVFTYKSGSKYEAKIAAGPGGTSFAGQPFEIVIEGGRLDFKNTGGAQPIICDGFSQSAVGGAGPAPPGAIGGGSSAQTAGESSNSGTVTIAVILLFIAAVGGYFYWKKQQAAGGAAKDQPMYPVGPQGGGAAPPPPQGAPLPAGWTEMSDPASGAKYYYNQSTGQVRAMPCHCDGDRPPPATPRALTWPLCAAPSLLSLISQTTWTKP